MYLGNFNTSARIDDEITMVTSDGTPTAVTTGSLVCRRGGTTALAPAGVTAITTSGGLHTFTIFTGSSTTYFLAGYDYSTYFGAGTITTTSVVGYVVNKFSILNRVSNVVQVNGSTAIFQSAADVADAVWDESRSGHATGGTYGEAVTGVINTTSANVKQILGVTSTGTAGYFGIDWAATSGTTFVKAVTTVSGFDWASVTGTATVNANVQNVRGVGSKGAAGYVGNDWATSTGTATVQAGQIGWGSFTGTATLNANVQNIKGVGSIGTAGYVGTDWAATTGTATVNTNVQNIEGIGSKGAPGYVAVDWASTTGTASVTVDVTKVLGVAINPLISGRVDANAQAVANAAISSATFAAGAFDAAALAADASNEIADALLAREINGGASAGDRTVKSAFKALRNKTVITTTGQLSVYEADDNTTAWTAVTTTATAVSITSVDPV